MSALDATMTGVDDTWTWIDGIERMPAFLEEIRATRPDLVYTWGTSVTLGAVGAHDGIVQGRHITDIPVVFTLVRSSGLAKDSSAGGS